MPRALLVLTLNAGALGAQYDHERNVPSTPGKVVAANVLIGGIIASTHALFGGKDPLRAFGVGALGGAVHAFGKIAGATARPVGLLTNTVSATGSSMIANGGRGNRMFEELFVPYGPVRFRVSPYSAPRFRMAINAFEAAELSRAFLDADLRLDRTSSMRIGTFVFDSRTLLRESAPNPPSGATITSLVIMSPIARDPPRTLRHEHVHVQQYWFLQETIDKPLEGWYRPRMPIVRRLPKWIELGVVWPSVQWLELQLYGRHGPIRERREIEAETLERR